MDEPLARRARRTGACPQASAPIDARAVELRGVGRRTGPAGCRPAPCARRRRRSGRRRAGGGCAPQASAGRGRRSGGLRQRRQLAGGLVVGELADAADVALLAGERRGRGRPRRSGSCPPASASGRRRRRRWRRCARGPGRPSPPTTPGRSGCRHLVGRDLLAVAGAADDHAEAVEALGPLGGDPLGRAQAEDGVVVERRRRRTVRGRRPRSRGRRSQASRWSFSSRPAWSEPRCTRMAEILSDAVAAREEAGHLPHAAARPAGRPAWCRQNPWTWPR